MYVFLASFLSEHSQKLAKRMVVVRVVCVGVHLDVLPDNRSGTEFLTVVAG